MNNLAFLLAEAPNLKVINIEEHDVERLIDVQVSEGKECER